MRGGTDLRQEKLHATHNFNPPTPCGVGRWSAVQSRVKGGFQSTHPVRGGTILAFNRQLMRGEKHTREEFWEALSSVDRYHKYCDAHPEYPNERAVHAIHNIGRVYDDRQMKNDFLPD